MTKFIYAWFICFFAYNVRTSHAQDYNCQDYLGNPRVCLPGPENLVNGRGIDVTPGMTCGNPAGSYCRSSQPIQCFMCNAKNASEKHPPDFMIDPDYPTDYWAYGFKPTWWQSLTWWDAYQQQKLVDNVLKVNLTLSMNKTYDITGVIAITFYSNKPHAVALERSTDNGVSWKPYRYSLVKSLQMMIKIKSS